MATHPAHAVNPLKIHSPPLPPTPPFWVPPSLFLLITPYPQCADSSEKTVAGAPLNVSGSAAGWAALGVQLHVGCTCSNILTLHTQAAAAWGRGRIQVILSMLLQVGYSASAYHCNCFLQAL